MPTMPTNRKRKPNATPAVRRSQTRIKRRDREILRLWKRDWPAKRIAERLAIKPGTVGSVVQKNQASRKPRNPRTTVVSAADAPIEAWQQAMLPKLEEIAKDLGASGATKRAIVFMLLLQVKPYEDIEEFGAWVHQATGYDKAEIAVFMERGIKGFMIVDGQPNREILDDTALKDSGAVGLILLAKMLEGQFGRTADGKFFLPENPNG